MDALDPRTAYSKIAYERWHARLEVDSPADSPWHQLVKAHLNWRDLDGTRVLEIGCGRGGFACWLAASSPCPREIVAVDFAQSAVDMGQKVAEARGLTGISWQTGDIQHLAQTDDSFDTVISCETVEHVPNPRGAVAELARVLKPGGRLLLTTPNYLGAMGLYRAYRRVIGRPFTEEGQPINHFTMLPLTRRWFRQAGLCLSETDGLGHYLPFPGRPPIRMKALDRLRPLTRWAALHSLVVARKPMRPTEAAR